MCLFAHPTSLQIFLENRYKGDDGGNCLLSVDGTHFRIQRRGEEFYSHKFNDSGLSYELALSIKGGTFAGSMALSLLELPTLRYFGRG